MSTATSLRPSNLPYREVESMVCSYCDEQKDCLEQSRCAKASASGLIQVSVTLGDFSTWKGALQNLSDRVSAVPPAAPPHFSKIASSSVICPSMLRTAPSPLMPRTDLLSISPCRRNRPPQVAPP